MPQVTYTDRAAIVQFYEKLQPRLAALPGIQNAGLVSILPLAPKSISFIHFTRPDQPPSKPENTPSTNYRIITPDYFRAMGIPLLEGRHFTEEDNGDRRAVAIVSSVLAKNHFPDRSPIGQRVMIDDNDAQPRPVEIVGVVGPSQASQSRNAGAAGHVSSTSTGSQRRRAVSAQQHLLRSEGESRSRRRCLQR